MRILLIKTSSLGDVIHNLPVVSDIAARFSGAEIDWVVEEAFADIPRLHPSVGKIIPVALRRWRKALFARTTWQEIGGMSRMMRATRYDAVIDTQGLIKSAWLSRKALGARHGMDAASAREPFAARFYHHTHPVQRQLHAVPRNRLLAAAALGYAITDGPDYGLIATMIGDLPSGNEQALASAPYAVLLSATSRDDKLWPEDRWVALGKQLAQDGLVSLLPAGSLKERERAQRIASLVPDATVVPPSSIAGLATLMKQAQCVVGVDTGLVHLAAALGRPTVALYCASVPELTGVMADRASTSGVVSLGAVDQVPEVADVSAALRHLQAVPA